MTTIRMMLTRRNFLRYGGMLTASIASESCAINSLLFGGTPIRVAVADYGRRSLPVFHAAMRSPNFEVLAICGSRFTNMMAIDDMCSRFGKRRPIVTTAMEITSNPSVEALLVADDSDENTELAYDSIRFRKNIFFSHPSRAAVFKDSTVSGSCSSRIHVGLLSAYDREIDEAVAYIYRNGPGQIVTTQIFTPPAEEWVWLEAFNITHLIFEKLERSPLEPSPKAGQVAVPFRGGPHNVEVASTASSGAVPAIRIRGTRGSLHIPLYTAKDRLEALSPILEVFGADIRSRSVSIHKSLEQTKRAHLLLSTAQRSVLSVSPIEGRKLLQ